MIMTLFDLSDWLKIPAKSLWSLTTHPDEPLPIWDLETMRFYKPDVVDWVHRWGMAAPGEVEGPIIR